MRFFPFCLAFISLRAIICLILLFWCVSFFLAGKKFAACFSLFLLFLPVLLVCFMVARNILYNMCVCVCVFVCGKPSSAWKCAWAIERQHYNKEGQISECVDSKRLSMCIFLTLTVFLLRFLLWLLLGIFVCTLHNKQQNSWYIFWMKNNFVTRIFAVVVDAFFCFHDTIATLLHFYKFQMCTMRI